MFSDITTIFLEDKTLYSQKREHLTHFKLKSNIFITSPTQVATLLAMLMINRMKSFQ